MSAAVAHAPSMRGGGRPGGLNLIVGYARSDAVVAVGDDGAGEFNQGCQVWVAAAGARAARRGCLTRGVGDPEEGALVGVGRRCVAIHDFQLFRPTGRCATPRRRLFWCPWAPAGAVRLDG